MKSFEDTQEDEGDDKKQKRLLYKLCNYCFVASRPLSSAAYTSDRTTYLSYGTQFYDKLGIKGRGQGKEPILGASSSHPLLASD